MKPLNVVIDGGVYTDKDYEAWTNDFLDWLESRGEEFGGATMAPREEDMDGCEETPGPSP